MYDLPVEKLLSNGNVYVHVDAHGNRHMRKEFEAALERHAQVAKDLKKK